MSRGARPAHPDRIDSEVLAWRVDRLHDAGFDHELSKRLAGDLRWDLHAVLELVDRGCAPALAARILAPLDDEDVPC
jgi:hypothetical protein